MFSSTSFTGSWSEFSRWTMLASSVGLSPLDSPPSKTYKWALKFELFLVFLEKNYEKRKNVMKFLTGLCQDDVTTWRGDVISRKKLHGHVRDKFLGKVTEGIFKICYGSGVMQQKVGLRVNLPPPPLVLCVLINGTKDTKFCFIPCLSRIPHHPCDELIAHGEPPRMNARLIANWILGVSRVCFGSGTNPEF